MNGWRRLRVEPSSVADRRGVSALLQQIQNGLTAHRAWGAPPRARRAELTLLLVLVLFLVGIAGAWMDAAMAQARTVGAQDGLAQDGLAQDREPSLVFTEERQLVRAGRSLELFVDGTASLDFAAVQRAYAEGRFVRSSSDSPSFGFTESVVWARLTVDDRRPRADSLVLQLAYAPLDRLELYGPDSGAPPLVVTGDTLPFSARAFAHRYPNVLLPAKAGKAVYYLRASGSSSLMLPVRVLTEPAYVDSVVTDQAGQALYVGIMLALIAYNLFLFFGVRERGYLLYSVFITLYLLYQSSMGGITFQYLWPENTWLPQRAMPIAVVSAAFFGKLFVGYFLGTREAAPRLHRVIGGFAVLYLLYIPFAAFGPALIAFPSTAALALTFSFVVLCIAAVRLRRGGRPARFFLLAWGFFLVGNILASLRLTGLAPANFVTENAQQLGSALEGVLLSLGLADRIRVLTEQADQAQRERAREREQTAQELQVLNDELRRQILERSREVASLLQEVSRGNVAELAQGSYFDGRYLIRKLLARGGMGSVYEVERRSDHKRLALKVLMGGSSPTFAARFAREAGIAASLRHPYLVAILDFGISAGRTMFLVMELVDGPPLEAERSRFGEVDWAVPILAQVAEGLAQLHKNGVVHRDLKPSNVLLARDAQGRVEVKIADFGLSREEDSAASTGPEQQQPASPTLLSEGAPSNEQAGAWPRILTRTGTFLGTPYYMAPELALGAAAVHPPADVFSFGVMAFEMLTGTSPFPSPPLYDRLSGRGLTPPAPLGELCPGLAADVCDLLLGALLEDPAARPTMRALSDALGGQRQSAAS